MAAWDEPHELLAGLLRRHGSSDPENDARTLLHHFGSVPRILDASWWRLWSAAGWRAAKAVRVSAPETRNKLRRDVVSRPAFQQKRLLLEFIARCEPIDNMPFLAVYVDADLRLIRVEHARHDVDQYIVDVSAQIERADAIGAHGFFLARSAPEALDVDTTDIRAVAARGEDEALPLLAQVHVPDGIVLFVAKSSAARMDGPCIR